MSTAEKNRVIAEWIEPFTVPFANKTDAWILTETATDRFEAEPVDFYSSEEASSLILEKLPFASLLNDHGKWTCESDWRFFHNGYTHKDRKTAIAECAYEYVTAYLGPKED